MAPSLGQPVAVRAHVLEDEDIQAASLVFPSYYPITRLELETHLCRYH